VAAEGIPVETLLKEGHIVNEILETIIQGGFDLVIMGSRGQSMIKNLLLGSVSNGVIRHASCSVLVAKK
jgi:nucleotide-binding universal stress UspA family protein